jgi:hypothetical protein
MAGAAALDGRRYRAFISYSHKDAAFATRLHRRLEGYVLPKGLGPNRRLMPIFKDREELPAAHDLSAQVRTALGLSDCLIVVCSPNAAASSWVSLEITTFRELQPQRPILAALMHGDPPEAFGPTLLVGQAEPLAADFRKQGDGEHLALLKLAAAIAGVGVDHLVQRDAQRQMRRVTALTATALCAVVAMGSLTAFALLARADAERQRAEAEGLVEFMLTDLRTGLKGFGSLDALTAVNKRALSYYQGQDFKQLSVSSTERWARIFLAMGEDDANRGNIVDAHIAFERAYRTTNALLGQSPDNADRIWAHAQSNYWLGYIGYLRGQSRIAKHYWLNYRSLAKRLAGVEPNKTRTVRELAFAESNLCTVAIELDRDAANATHACAGALAFGRKLAAEKPLEASMQFELANHLAWMADAEKLAGNSPGAVGYRREQLAILNSILKDDPHHADYLFSWGSAQKALGTLAYDSGDLRAARSHTLALKETFIPLAARDPENKHWRDQLSYADRALAAIDQKQKDDNQ